MQEFTGIVFDFDAQRGSILFFPKIMMSGLTFVSPDVFWYVSFREMPST